MGEIKPKPLETLKAWSLQDAKAHFSEVVRTARAGEPQRVTTRGEDAVVVLSAADYARLVPIEEGVSLWDAVRTWPPFESDEFDRIMREMDENPVYSPVTPPPDLDE